MIADHSDLTGQPNREAAAVRPVSPCYVAAPALPDILNEQMLYLLGHADHNKAGCSDCVRLGQVVQLLMRPFE